MLARLEAAKNLAEFRKEFGFSEGDLPHPTTSGVERSQFQQFVEEGIRNMPDEKQQRARAELEKLMNALFPLKALK